MFLATAHVRFQTLSPSSSAIMGCPPRPHTHYSSQGLTASDRRRWIWWNYLEESITFGEVVKRSISATQRNKGRIQALA